MATSQARGAGYRNHAVRHSKDDALSRRAFETLLEATYRLDDYYGLQAKFIVLVAGRLGMRAGEIAHMKAEWVNWRRNMITIPYYEECTKGRDGCLCGYCEQKAAQKVAHDSDLTIEQARASMWSPKTDAGAREIPIDATPRAEMVIEDFFDRFDEWPVSRQAINRRVNRAAEEASGIEVEAVYPHALRATAASYWAANGLDVFALKAMMGWAQLSTAKVYVASSGERTAQAIRDSMV